jgi:hypothetical protein
METRRTDADRGDIAIGNCPSIAVVGCGKAGFPGDPCREISCADCLGGRQWNVEPNLEQDIGDRQ